MSKGARLRRVRKVRGGDYKVLPGLVSGSVVPGGEAARVLCECGQHYVHCFGCGRPARLSEFWRWNSASLKLGLGE